MRAPVITYPGPSQRGAVFEVYRVATQRDGEVFVVLYARREIGRQRSHPDREQCLAMLARGSNGAPGERNNLSPARPAQRGGYIPGVAR